MATPKIHRRIFATCDASTSNLDISELEGGDLMSTGSVRARDMGSMLSFLLVRDGDSSCVEKVVCVGVSSDPGAT
jgi:hypothetical protein